MGVLGFLAGDSFGYPLVGLGVYWAAVVGMVGIWKGTSFQVFDERERALDRRASQITLTVVGLAVIVVGPGRVLFTELGIEFSPMVEGAIWGFAAELVLFGVVYLGLRYGR